MPIVGSILGIHENFQSFCGDPKFSTCINISKENLGGYVCKSAQKLLKKNKESIGGRGKKLFHYLIMLTKLLKYQSRPIKVKQNPDRPLRMVLNRKGHLLQIFK